MYVVIVEKKGFKNQMAVIADSLVDDITSNKEAFVTTIDNKKDVNIIINGILDTVEESVKINSSPDSDNVIKKNKKLQNSATNTLIIICFGVIILAAVIVLSGFCIPMTKYMKLGLISVGVVAVVEYAFLNVISSKYIAADPYQVKRELYNNISKWISANKK